MICCGDGLSESVNGPQYVIHIETTQSGVLLCCCVVVLLCCCVLDLNFLLSYFVFILYFLLFFLGGFGTWRCDFYS